VGANGLSPHISSYEQGHNGAKWTVCTQARYKHSRPSAGMAVQTV